MISMDAAILSKIRFSLVDIFRSDIVAHDIYHLYRVEETASRICAIERGRPFVVGAAALLHDYHRVLERQERRHISPEEAQPYLENFLREFNVPSLIVEHICKCVNFTERYICAGDVLDKEEISIEEKIVRDADMLDALGPIGIARAFMFGGYLGEPIWVETAPVAEVFSHGKSHSIVHHFYEKLLNLHREMQTESGKREAKEKTIYMENFIKDLMTGMRGRP